MIDRGVPISSDVGLDGSHGRSPGGTGRLFPDATLPTLAGGSLILDHYRPRWDLVVVMLGEDARAPDVSRLLVQLAAAQVELEGEDGRVIVVVAGAPSPWPGGWPYPFPLAFDAAGQLHHRVAAIDAAGRPAPAVYVTDRYREIFVVLRPGDARWPATAREILDWLTFVDIQCPECNAPES